MKKIYTFISVVVLTVNAFAQAPEKMSYQAVIRDVGNTLVTNQTVGMQISLLQSSATGTAVYVETQTPSTNANGLVSLEIGTGTTTDDFSTIDWSAGPYFIKTETDPASGTNYTITGTSQLLSVPYALYAKTSGNSNYKGTSNTSINLGSFGECLTYPSYGCASGTATLTTTNALSYTAGMRVRVSATLFPALEFLEGVITSYDGTTMVITVGTVISSNSGTFPNTKTFSSWHINLGAGLPGYPGPKGDNGMVFGQAMSCRNFVTPNGPAPIGNMGGSKILTYYSGSAFASFDITLILDSGNGGITNGSSIAIYESPTNTNYSISNFTLVGSYTFSSDISANTIVSIQVPVFITRSNVILNVSSEDFSGSVGVIEVCL